MLKALHTSLFLLWLTSAAASGTEEIVLWGEGAPPDEHEIGYPAGIRHVEVHAAGDGDSGEYTFLLGPAIVEHQGTLFASWANGLHNENDAATQVTRGRLSRDGGNTWSAPFVIAPRIKDGGGLYHAHGSFLSHGSDLFAFIPKETIAGKNRPGLMTRLFRYDPSTNQWVLEKDLIDKFYPMDEPLQRADGRWIIGGVDDESKPAVAISDTPDISGAWRALRIESVPSGFETSVWVDGDDVTAFIRNHVPDAQGDLYLAAVRSPGGGEDWTLDRPVHVPRSRLPAVDSKVFAGRLDIGQGYLVYNLPVGRNGNDRRVLAIAVTAPGETRFRRVFALRAFGEVSPRVAGHYKGVGWQYPYAHSSGGNLYIVSARAKEDCDLTIVPVDSLAVDAPSTPIAPNEFPRPYFTRHYAFRSLGPGRSWGQTALADLDRDGDLDFVTGLRGGDIQWFEYQGRRPWERHTLGVNSPSDVGGAAADVNGDGWIDFVAGGAWYENTRRPRAETFTRHAFDPSLQGVHDIVIGDIDGDGNDDVVTMSDRNDLRWYSVPKDPTQPWPHTRIHESVHAGLAIGDLDRDGDLDVVRSNIWLENQGGGKRWTSHQLSQPWGNRDSSFSHNATRAAVADIDGDGANDVILADAEIRAPRIAWLKSPPDPRTDPWELHVLPPGDPAIRGPYHSLQVADFDADGDLDIFAAEMEHISGSRPPRWFIWENSDGRGAFVERTVLDANLGSHEAKAGDVDGDGDIDICSKPWAPAPTNANGGRSHFDYLENLTVRPQ